MCVPVSPRFGLRRERGLSGVLGRPLEDGGLFGEAEIAPADIVPFDLTTVAGGRVRVSLMVPRTPSLVSLGSFLGVVHSGCLTP